MGSHIDFTVRVPVPVTGRFATVKSQHPNEKLFPENRICDLYGILGLDRYEDEWPPCSIARRGWPEDTTGCEVTMDGSRRNPSFATLSELRDALSPNYDKEDIMTWLNWLADSPVLTLRSGGTIPNPGPDQIQIVWGFD